MTRNGRGNGRGNAESVAEGRRENPPSVEGDNAEEINGRVRESRRSMAAR